VRPNGCRKQDRVGSGPKTLFRLQASDAAAQKGIPGDLGLHASTLRIEVVVGQDRLGAEVICIDHHQPSGQDTDRPFQDAHMDVHFKALYTLAAEERGRESNGGRVIGSENFLHVQILRRARTKVERNKRHHVSKEGPFERLQTLLAPDMECVNALIAERMASDHAPRIPEVTAHLVGAGGKRLRPLLTLATAALCGYRGDDHIRLAATVEFIHTATLLHDDVVDESGQRRGRPTANLLWDNKSSVLVGDYLFARAFLLMVETGSLRVLDILSRASATIAEGEVLQLTAARNLKTTRETYMQVVRGKTAALFEAATHVGGVIANADAATCGALVTYGDALGTSFQIVDDLLDYGGTQALGKNIGDDFRERKMSLPVILAVEEADKQERGFWDRTIAKGDQRDGDLEEALDILARRGALEVTREVALAEGKRASDALASLPQSKMRDLLVELSDFVVARAV